MHRDLPPAQLREVRTLDWMYGEGDLAEGEVFTGGFCNFGFWDSLPTSAARRARTDASAQLYRRLLETLNPSHGALDTVVEVGAGRGLGAALALAEFKIGRVIAIDRSAPQIERLLECQQPLVDSGRLDGRQGDAAALPVETAMADAVYSVEALQHFPSKTAFVREAARVLRAGGCFAVTTFFLTDAVHFDALRPLIPTVERGITIPGSIDAFTRALERFGFADIHVRSIGDQVFPGFDRWLEIIGERAAEPDSWGRNWLKCYRAGLIDYLVVDAGRADLPFADME